MSQRPDPLWGPSPTKHTKAPETQVEKVETN